MSTSIYYRSKKDPEGDRLEVVQNDIEYKRHGELLFSTPEDGVLLDVAGIKALRKALKAWLIGRGYAEDKATETELHLALTFDDEDVNTVLAVTLQDGEGRVLKTIWER